MTEVTSRSDPVADSSADESDDELIAKYIIRNPDGMGPDQAETVVGVPVWGLICHMRGDDNTVASGAEAYELPEVAVAWALPAG